MKSPGEPQKVWIFLGDGHHQENSPAKPVDAPFDLTSGEGHDSRNNPPSDDLFYHNAVSETNANLSRKENEVEGNFGYPEKSER